MQVRTAKEIGALVKARRKELDWSQQRLADEAGVKRLWVVQLEGGKSTVQLDLVFRALRVLGIKVDMSTSETQSSAAAPVVDLDSLLGDD